MIAGLDGAATLDGVSGGLGGDADHRVFHILRSLADVVLVAAGTVRAERYGPSSVPLAIVSRSCRLDFDAPLFTEPLARPLVLTVADAPPDRCARAAEVADVVVVGKRDVDLRRALLTLGKRGLGSVLAEGGPGLNAQLAAAGLLDELCLTVSPRVVGGQARRILDGAPLTGPRNFGWRSLCEEDGFLFLRLRPAA